ncbi:MAG: phenylacetate-CoA oxygenase subunit PaaC [Bacteroidetes bacterium]|nr:phenylacetate-CoA oxygenase subunit PaaC [Bacteroidota bacterium]
MKTKEAIYTYCLRIADSNLILGQRLAEWCSRGPILEEDLAMTNISLDLFGQAETLYEYAASIKGNNATADSLAFLRVEREYCNRLIVEQPNGDFAFTMVRELLFSSFQKNLYEALYKSNDEMFKGFAGKAVKEAKYHLRHSSEWVIRLGQGTEESHRRTQWAIDELWRYTADMFEMNEVDEELISMGIAPDLKEIQKLWIKSVMSVTAEAGLTIPETPHVIKGGNDGIHTEHLGHILCELQYLQRAHPGASW